MKFDLNKFLQNKVVLYVTLFLSITSILGYIMARNNEAVILFLLVSFITSYFTKNMTTVLLSGLLITNLGIRMFTKREGLENKEDMEEDEEDDMEEDEEDDKKPTKKKVNKDRNANNVKALQKLKGGNNDNDDSAVVEPSPEIERDKTKKLAYENFEKALGGDGILGLTEEMDNMIGKHEKLQQTIENMGPIIDKAYALLDKVDGTKFGGMIDKLTSFTGAAANKSKK